MQYLLNQEEYEEYIMLKASSKQAVPKISEYEAIKDFIYKATIIQNRDPFDSDIKFQIKHTDAPEIFIDIMKERFSR